MPRAPSMLLLLAASLGPLACDEVPARSILSGWPPGEPVRAGACEFLLQSAALYHSTEWHLEVKVEARNTGPEAVRCAFSARAMTSSDTALTKAAEQSGELAPGDGWVHEAASREVNETGMSSGGAEGAWVYVELTEGHWPMDTSARVSVEPERTRPPG